MEKINVLLPELEFNVTNRSVVVGKIYHTKCCTLEKWRDNTESYDSTKSTKSSGTVKKAEESTVEQLVFSMYSSRL